MRELQRPQPSHCRPATPLTTNSYDALDRPTRAQNPDNQVITSAYDAVGNRSRMDEPGGGRFTYAYVGLNRVRTLDNPLNERTTFGYDKAGRQTAQEMANGVTTTHAYDAAGRTLGVTHRNAGGTTLDAFTYVYDKVGNPTRVAEFQPGARRLPLEDSHLLPQRQILRQQGGAWWQDVERQRQEAHRFGSMTAAALRDVARPVALKPRHRAEGAISARFARGTKNGAGWTLPRAWEAKR